MDPNIKDVSDALAAGGSVKMSFAHLEPQKIKSNTQTKFSAVYSDDYGSYDFEIHKTDKGYTVISDGNVCSRNNPDREYIIWNYETQVAGFMPEVLR